MFQISQETQRLRLSGLPLPLVVLTAVICWQTLFLAGSYLEQSKLGSHVLFAQVHPGLTDKDGQAPEGQKGGYGEEVVDPESCALLRNLVAGQKAVRRTNGLCSLFHMKKADMKAPEPGLHLFPLYSLGCYSLPCGHPVLVPVLLVLGYEFQNPKITVRLCCCLPAYFSWVIDAIWNEKQAHYVHHYLEEGILERAQHEQLQLLPEGGRGRIYKPHTLRKLRPCTQLPGYGWAPIMTKNVLWMKTR